MKSNEKELFAGACGATGPLVLDITDDGETHRARRIFQQPYLLVGRSPEADLKLRHEHVAARHCYFQMIGGRLFAIDLGSRGGIRINGETRRAGWIDRSQPLRIGPVGLVFQGGDAGGIRSEFHDPGPSPLSARYARAHPLPAATLEIASPGTDAHRWPMRRALVLIGRSPVCKLKLISPAIAEVHCALLRTTMGVWLIDLLAPGGVSVDGVQTRACRLDDGATLGLGPFTIRLRYGSGPARRARHAGPDDRRVPGPETIVATASPAYVSCGAPSSGPRPPATGVQDFLQVLLVAEVLQSMHRDQMEVARRERNEIRRLADEIRALRADLRNAALADPVEMADRDDPDRNIGRLFPRDPRELHLIARDFLEDYRLRRHSLREKLIRMLVGGPT